MTEELTAGEQIVLLALDEETGALREAPLRVSLAVSAAALLELDLAGHLGERDGAPVVVGASAPVGPAAAAMAAYARGHPGESPRQWLMAVRERALDAAYRGLTEKGLVRARGRRVLGAFGSVTYPVVERSQGAALRERLAGVLTRGADPDDRTAALIALLHHAGLRGALARAAGGEPAEDRPAAVAEGRWPAAALGDTIRTTVAALTAVVAATAL